MRQTSYPHLDTGAWGRALLRGAASWWHMVHFGAIVLVMALSPSTYNRANRATTAKHIYASTWQVLPWFTALSALLSLVLIRVVVVTAQSYGLSQYALQMVVRVLVLELIPLSAAVFVALRAGLAFNMGAATSALSVQADSTPRLSVTRLRVDLVPRVMASAFAVLTLAMVSSVIALVQAYITVYGLSPWGLPGYTRTVAHVFDLAVTLGFLLKTILFSLAVAVVPVAASLEAPGQPASADTVQPGAVRLFLVLLLIEAGSLAIKYI
ncbi:ABC transporter permease [Rhodoferax sp.]|uniref:MlaE family ABC transporter permease n=1 Tax=Rhodoferax sp. TaxID=50421 RepID=UPI002724AE51|nr:ABC transporter permease [Rhodoferax sp.]MDO9196781.1 ABC transporter permease [Rhodoferax sp.]